MGEEMLNFDEMPLKLLLSAMIIFGLLFPDFIWNGDTVSVTDQDGNDVTAEMSGQEIFEGVYEAEELTFSISWF